MKLTPLNLRKQQDQDHLACQIFTAEKSLIDLHSSIDYISEIDYGIKRDILKEIEDILSLIKN